MLTDGRECADPRFGELVMECHKKSFMREMIDTGNNRASIIYSLIMLYILGPVFTSLPFTPLLQGAQAPLITDPFWGSMLGLWYFLNGILYTWYFFYFSRRGHVQLWTAGVHVKGLIGSWWFPFDELQRVSVGDDQHDLPLFSRFWAAIKRCLRPRTLMQAVTFYRRDKSFKRFEGLVGRFENADRLIQELRSVHAQQHGIVVEPI